MPRWGWHDDHRALDKTPNYLPAFMQVRSEFAELVDALKILPAYSVLQLGTGPCDASYAVWRAICGRAVSIDLNGCISADGDRYPGASTHSETARVFAALNGPYDVLFIDAAHSEDDARADELDYAPLVRPGGIVAFHDALPRADYPEVTVWRHLAKTERVLHTAGREVGIAWYIKP